MIDSELIFKKIEEFDSIVICGHQLPDGDCYGSIMGLTLTLRHYYPEKKIYPVINKFRVLPKQLEQGIMPDTLEDSIIENSLVFILDLANSARLDEKRATKGKYVIRIDHHIYCETFSDYEFVDSSISSCCQIVSKLVLDKFKSIPSDASTAFMMGIVTDTGRFQYGYDSELFNVASLLAANGAKNNDIYNALYTTEIESFKLKSYIYSHFKAKNGVAYIVFPYKDLQKLGVSTDSAASNVNQIGSIRDYPIWISFGEYQNGSVRVEFRCNTEYNINPLAVKFGGGGHKQASGCKLEKLSDYKKVIKEAMRLEKYKITEFTYEEYCKKHDGNRYFDILKDLISVGIKAKKEVMKIYKTDFNVDIKSDDSPVTNADLASNKIIIDELSQKYPNFAILSEETADNKDRLNNENLFIIDPIDGTSDYVSRDGEFAINIAYAKSGRIQAGIVVIPVKNLIYFAYNNEQSCVYNLKTGKVKLISCSKRTDKLVKLVSRMHEDKTDHFPHLEGKITKVMKLGSAFKGCKIAEGVADIYATGSGNTKEWDVAPLDIILRNANGCLLDRLTKEEFKFNRENPYNENGFIIVNSVENLQK